MNLLLYALTVFFWGTTWIAIHWQLGVVPSEISIFYRSAISAVVLLLYCLIRGHSLRFTLKEHSFLALHGLLMCYYIFVYKASLYLVSGVASVFFSMTCSYFPTSFGRGCPLSFLMIPSIGALYSILRSPARSSPFFAI